LVALKNDRTVLSHLASLGTVVLQVLIVVDGVGLIVFGEHSRTKIENGSQSGLNLIKLLGAYLGA